MTEHAGPAAATADAARLHDSALRMILWVRPVGVVGLIVVLRLAVGDDAGPPLPAVAAVLVASGVLATVATLRAMRMPSGASDRAIAASVACDHLNMTLGAAVLDPVAATAAWTLVLVPIGEAAFLLGPMATVLAWSSAVVALGGVALASGAGWGPVALLVVLSNGPAVVLALQAHLLRGALERSWRLGEVLHDQATRDPLTGLRNRRGLVAAMQRDGPATPYVLLFCDLDGFKAVNDTLGHEAGDEVLRVVGRRLEGATRSSDVVARIAGDEFVVALFDADDAALESVAARVRDNVAAPIDVRGMSATLGVSIGRARGSTDLDLASVLDEADAAMYADKHRRRDREHDHEATVG